jgi:ribosomal protein S18 acetylase RimI-like enzyme
MEPDDWRLWRELRLAALTEAAAAFSSTVAEWSGARDTEQRWRARLEGVALNLILTLAGEPAGMVSATAPNAEGRIELISMWITPAARGQGVGDAAIRHVLAWAREKFPDSHVVLSVKADNDHARTLYERHGFLDSGLSPDDPDERLMLL